MPYLLNACYILLLLAASPWLLWSAWRRGKYRQGFAARFLGRVNVPETSMPRVWIHAVSVGEVNLIATLIDRLRAHHRDLDFVITTTTRTGYELALRKYSSHSVSYCPLDFSWAVQTAIKRIKPNLLVLVELEIWPNLLRTADRLKVPVAIVNGRLSEKSFRGYRRIRPLMTRWLRRVECLAVQNETYAERFRQLGAPDDKVFVSGSLKFDGAQTDRGNRQTEELRRLWSVRPDDVVLLAGSTQDPEEAMVLRVYDELKRRHPRLRLILVPRHPERFEAVAQLLGDSRLAWQRRTELQKPQSNPSDILLVDTIGELGAWWGVAQIAFVGGSMGSRGGQNMLEPAGYGAAVSFGPKTRNFRDIVAALLEADAACVVADQAQLTAFVERCLTDTDWQRRLGERARHVVLSQVGAAETTARQLLPLLPSASPDRRVA